MVIKVPINGSFIPMNQTIFMAISFKLMGIKIEVNEVEHFTDINVSLHFSEILH